MREGDIAAIAGTEPMLFICVGWLSGDAARGPIGPEGSCTFPKGMLLNWFIPAEAIGILFIDTEDIGRGPLAGRTACAWPSEAAAACGRADAGVPGVCRA